uniref:Fibronectin type-III domain-containing protein n=1 Tax=Vombatus ursinus TaxID=29139 RepID=A0A4X2L7J0_VOMUR
GKKSSLKVYINTTGDSILMKFLRPDTNTKLEGFVLGYGSNSHSNQYFPLPAEGKSSEAEVDAEPKYLIVVRPVPPPSQKKKCSGKSRTRKPLQMVVGTLSPSSVFLSWGFLINPQYDWTLPTQCPNDRLYTVRYREKDKEKKWIFQLCPATETVVENLKPNTIYEFGVKDNLEGGLWSRIFNHKTVIGSKFLALLFTLLLHYVSTVIQNVTHRAASKSPDKPSVGGTILVHLIIPGLNETTLKGPPPVMLDISETIKTPLGKVEVLHLVSLVSECTEADIHRPTLPPPKSTQPQRKPLPPNNVTGKPGSTGINGLGLKLYFFHLPEILILTLSLSGNLTDFSSSPTRETDSLGNQRFMAPHVKYIPKPEDEPCSITDSVKRFPKEEVSDDSPTSPPQNPPTNLTVVTVEGCSSFVILDWEKPQNDTVTEYEVRSKENGEPTGKKESVQTTNQTFSTIENLKPNTSYEFQVTPRNPLGEGPPSKTVAFSTESADPRVSEPILAGRDAIWTEIPFKSDSYSECKGKQYVKRTWYKKFVGVQLCNSLRYKIYLSDSLTGKFYNIGDQRGHGEDHCQFVDSFLDGRTGQQLSSDQLPIKEGYFRAVRQEPVQFGEIGGHTQINYVQWYECGTTIPGKW